MIHLRPFRAWLVDSDLAQQVQSPPYDVVSKDEAHAIIDANILSFMRVIRPDGFADVDDIYQKALFEWQRMKREDTFYQIDEPSLFIYGMEQGNHKQYGIVGCVSREDYNNGKIIRHENVRDNKVEDRVELTVALKTYTEPVNLMFDSVDALNTLISKEINKSVLISIEDEDHVRHSIWKVNDTHAFISAFEKLDSIFIADGHHRCESAARSSERLGLDGHHEGSYFPAVIFPSNQLKILSYNRLMLRIPDNFESQLLKMDAQVITKNYFPSKGHVHVYYQNKWYAIMLEKSMGIIESLDCHRLYEDIINPLYHGKDMRQSSLIAFFGGETSLIEKAIQRVNEDDNKALFLLHPTRIEELIAVSRAGQLMPSKSTWFSPKLRSGLFTYEF